MKVAASGLAKRQDGHNAERMDLILDWMRKLARVRIEPSKDDNMKQLTVGEDNGRSRN